MQHPDVKAFFDEPSNTFSYVVSDPATKRAAVIDSVLDYDAASGRTRHDSADAIVAWVREHGLTVDWVIDTHVHADHLSAAPYIQQQLGGKLGIGEHIRTVQTTFGKLFNAGSEFARDGSQFDHLFADGETYRVGEIEAVAMHTPGHTPACMTHVIGDAAFVGDTLFMPDYGTARCDFPGGDAATLLRSSSCATTTRHRVATNTSTKPPWARRSAATCTCATASPRRTSCRCAPRATPRWRCPS